jgi:hypothetical protein
MQRQQFELLDRFVNELADPATADYGVLLANAQGLPGREFFWRYRVLHADEYEVTVGSDISHKEKRAEIRLAHDLTGVGRESMRPVS